MIYTGAGGIVFLTWLAFVWCGYYLLTAYDVDGWIALAITCAIAAVLTYAFGRRLNQLGKDHTFAMLPAQWIGLAAPAFFGVMFGLAELIRSL